MGRSDDASNIFTCGVIRRLALRCADDYRTMHLTVRFFTGICYLGWLVISIRGQDEKTTTFSSGSPWADEISQMESMAHFENHTLAQCGLKCLQVIFCQAFTFEENDRPNCSLHAKLLEIDHYHPVSKLRAKYFQRNGKTCREYLITGNRYDIPSSAITASSVHVHDDNCATSNSRLNYIDGAWCARITDGSQWIGVDLGVPMMITGVVTQGRSTVLQWVKSYYVSYSTNGAQFKTYRELRGEDKVFTGNTDSRSHVTNHLKFPILARHVRLHPKDWNMHISLRFDMLGCEV